MVEMNVSKLDVPVKKLKSGTIKTFNQNIVLYVLKSLSIYSFRGELLVLLRNRQKTFINLLFCI